MRTHPLARKIARRMYLARLHGSNVLQRERMEIQKLKLMKLAELAGVSGGSSL